MYSGNKLIIEHEYDRIYDMFDLSKIWIIRVHYSLDLLWPYFLTNI